MSNSAPPGDRLNERAKAGWVLGWLWMLFAAYNIGDILWHQWSRASAYAGSILLLISGIVWVVSLRPRLRADSDRVLLRNPLRDVDIPWGAVTAVEARDTVRVITDEKRYHSWVGHVPNRRRATYTRANVRARAAVLESDTRGRGFSTEDPQGSGSATPRTTTDYMVERLNDMWQRFRRPSQDAGHTEARVRWSWTAVGALAVPLVLVVLSFAL